MKPTVLFYCQHVLGMGHMVRSREIVKGLAEGADVWFVNGGEPVAGFTFPLGVQVAQLPPVRSDAEFREIDATGQVQEERRELLLQLYECVEPDVVVLEMFPFGRRKFAFELLPLLEACRAKGTRVVCSVRDILVSKRDQSRHEEQACRLLNAYFDLVLVHADPGFQRLEETFLRTADLRCEIAYTGFVAEPFVAPPAPNRKADKARIVVSVGGGRVGFPLLSAAISASTQLTSVAHDMHVFTGPYLDDHAYCQLEKQAGPHVTIERFAHDFVQRIAAADLLVSMAGYNTCMNILSTGVRALVLPFAGNQNEEQTIRARKLQELGCLSIINAADLEAPQRLAGRLHSMLLGPKPPQVPLSLSGVETTRRLLSNLCKSQKTSAPVVAHV
jgi:predicted glycosyltransferase